MIPLSSGHCHCIVPCRTGVTLTPPIPFMARFVSVKGPMKSLTLLEIQAEHRLSTPMGLESASKVVTRSFRSARAYIAIVVIAMHWNVRFLKGR